MKLLARHIPTCRLRAVEVLGPQSHLRETDINTQLWIFDPRPAPRILDHWQADLVPNGSW